MTKKNEQKELIRKGVLEFFNKQIPFNIFLGLDVQSTSELSEIRMKMKPDLIGNTAHNILHGGVTSAILDVAGGVVAIINTSENLVRKNAEDIQKRLFRMSTIDIRIDYLLPGRGEEFIAKAHIIRRGSKIAVTRMQLTNEKEELIALGTATYLVG